MQDPTLAALHLGSERKLIVLLRQALAVAFHHTSDGNPPDHGRGDSQAFQHGETPSVASGDRDSTNRREPGRGTVYCAASAGWSAASRLVSTLVPSLDRL